MDLKAILNKYINGTATPAEVELVEKWYASFREDVIPHERVEKEQLRKEIVSGIMEHLPQKSDKRWWKVAAAVVVLVTGSALFFKPRPVKITAVAKLVNTAAGTRKVITLSDGSVIHLNALTQITIPGDYGVKDRRVQLSGEAFFEITPDPAHPFIVSSGTLNTTVLGTSFNIRAYKEQKEWQITVATGKVKVVQSQQVLSDSLTASRCLAYNFSTKETTISNIPGDMTGAWRKNIFYFNNSTLSEIGEELQRQYNIQVTVTGKNRGHYKISFSQQPLEKVLKVLSGLTGITYAIHNKEVIIHSKN
ncbi:FecR family protein [Chitinophaga sp. YR573]|uniref:FecR family protein n=1 Tax=Chitinophaga sp. YR573 TaxID=1881040 RepID=UPI0008D3A76D|nr:FecR family protein [Chitinophaga sp. YR573]SEW37457.1 FecR family protein [Chitinophaga sp. YR573]